MELPRLADAITVISGTDVDEAWKRFLSMEALHHLHEICNPMTSSDLDRVVHAVAPGDGDHAVDVACGHGEYLIRLATRSAVRGVGIDLSPWVLNRAVQRAAQRALKGRLEWRLGDGATLPHVGEWDIATCLGATWIWHGFEGTLRALTARIRSGGRIALGDLRLRRGLRPSDAAELGARPLTESDQLDHLREAGLRPVEQIVATDDAWEAYHRLVIESAESFATTHSAYPEADFRSMAHEWMVDFERDRRYLEWTIWVARRRATL